MKCPCCKYEKIIDWPRVNLFKCIRCGHAWQNLILPFDYANSYLKSYSKCPTVEMSWLRIGLLFMFLQNGKILDYGCGDGEFVKQANRAGYESYGFDVCKRENIPFSENPSKTDKWDVVTMFDSFEHLEDLDVALGLKPKMFIITVPNLKSNMDEDSVLNWKHYKPNEHLHYFTYNSIVKYFSKNKYVLQYSEPIEDLIRKDKNKKNTITYVFKNIK